MKLFLVLLLSIFLFSCANTGSSEKPSIKDNVTIVDDSNFEDQTLLDEEVSFSNEEIFEVVEDEFKEETVVEKKCKRKNHRNKGKRKNKHCK